MKDWAYQVQRMLADELDKYKERGNVYVDENIWEIQDLYKDERQKELEEGRIENKEVILIKPYKVSTTTFKTTKSSSIYDEVKNLEWHMKFVYSPIQTRLFQPPSYYQSLQFRGEQNLEF